MLKVGSSRQGKGNRRRQRKGSDQQLGGRHDTGDQLGQIWNEQCLPRILFAQWSHNSTFQRGAILPKKPTRHSKDPERRASATAKQAIITLEPIQLDKLQTDLHKSWTTGGRQRHVVGSPALATGSGSWIRETRYGDQHRRKTNEAFTNRIVGASEWSTSRREKVLLKEQLCCC
jgi:hypothetical protein